MASGFANWNWGFGSGIHNSMKKGPICGTGVSDDANYIKTLVNELAQKMP